MSTSLVNTQGVCTSLQFKRGELCLREQFVNVESHSQNVKLWRFGGWWIGLTPDSKGPVFDNPVNQLISHPTPLMLMNKGKRKETDLFQNKSQNVPSPPVQKSPLLRHRRGRFVDDCLWAYMLVYCRTHKREREVIMWWDDEASTVTLCVRGNQRALLSS